MVEEFDGVVARGYATQSGTPMIAVRQDGKLAWWRGAEIVVPSPILLDDWDLQPQHNVQPQHKAQVNAQPQRNVAGETQIEYSKRVQLPASWRDCVVRLEIAPSSLHQPENVSEAWANDRFLGRRFAPPLSFIVTPLGTNAEISSVGKPNVETEKAGASGDEISLVLTLRLEAPQEADIWEPPLARLVAYPRVEIGRPS